MQPVQSDTITTTRPTSRSRPVIAGCLLAVLLAMLDASKRSPTR
jgi:hypothetical protein